MYLKRLKLRNFKSFAGSTEIPFQRGFTGVAGPNGMGKSNISDAILFVLGPTSSKALRADRLTHLFFNGGSSKKPATECEVSLQFDNSDRLLPVDSEDVEITRYVKLAPSDPNGYYSYFYVNGKRSTQTEIDAVLSHARLSGDGYNLVQQGDVNRIVSMGPVPRRGLVERLAGISQYDDELQRADAKRADLEQNLDRIRTLLTEVKGHLAQLDSQREQAIKYKQTQDEKRRAEARLARAGHRIAQQEVVSCEQNLAKLNQELVHLKEAQAKLEAEAQEVGTSIDAIEREVAKRGGAEAAKFQQELNDRRMAFARLDENVKQAEEELDALGQRVQSLSNQIKTDEKEAERLGSASTVAGNKLRTVESKAEELAGQLKAATGDAEQSQGKLAATRKQILQLQRELEERQRAWQTAVGAHEKAKATVDGAEREQGLAEDDARTREVELKDVELRLKQSRSPKDGATSTPALQKEFFEVKNKEKSLTARCEDLQKEVLELNRRYTALEARLKARTDGGARANPLAAVDFLLSQRNLGRISGIRGTVEELASFDSDYQTALQVAGGNRFQALVVESDQVAEECVRLLRQEKRGRATFLPLNKMLAGRPKGKSLIAAQSGGAVGFAIDLVKFDEELRPAFWYVFGETVVMKDLARAREQMGGVRLVTMTGELIEATGAITGGYIETGDRGRGGDNAAELKRLGEELRLRSTEDSDSRAELKRLEERARTLGEELARRTAQDEAHSSTQKVLDQDLATARQRLTEARGRIEAARKGLATATKTLAEAEATVQATADALQKGKQSLAQFNDDYLGHLPQNVSSRIRALQESHQTAVQEQVAAARELESAKAAFATASSSLEQRRAELSQEKEHLLAKQKEIKSLRTNRDSAKESLEALRSMEQQQSKVVEAHLEEKRKLEARRLKLTEDSGRQQEALRTRGVMAQQEEVRLATARQRLTEVEAALKEFPEPEADEKPVPADELKRTIQTLQAELDSMGSVNLRALEEYDAEKKRLDEFDGESTRLSTEKSELTGLVGEIEKKKRTKLTEVVGAVNVAYREIYADLSGGGEGEIALENSDDPLAGGLLIKARPVGKNVQRLEQLSGGEKSLASLAFVFSLQRYDPSPLYVFDEVDMSLDGVNAENVGRMLRRNAERAQFIVISLRKVTLKCAHRLFGVTMHGDGCSRVVSLKLDEIVDVDERERAEAKPPVIAAGAA
ncbi:MAG TPA: chromosome segregation protein SMC [Thermoplasmata archaeon]|nr:chromosome segregation protein SMC [Thermoplasmata archaeon]